MRKLLLATILLLSTWVLKAQTQLYGNEWIDYTQTHYKIKVAADGMYRIPYSTLAGIIPNLSALNTGSFVMYHNGQKVPIYVSSTTHLGPNDYIDFYGKKNIGDLDSMLYANGDIQAHPYYSLFTDTSIYYLTIKTIGSNPRITETTNNLVNPPAKENYFTQIVRQVYANRYYEGKYYNISTDEVYKSTFEDGEGYVNNSFFGTVTNGNPAQATQLNFNLATPSIYPSGPPATVKCVLVTNSNGETHNVHITLNSQALLDTTRIGFSLIKYTTQVPLSSLVNNGSNAIRYSATGNAISKKQNAVYMNEISYPRSFDFGGSNAFYFQLPADPGNKKYIEVINFNDEGQQPLLYDITNGYFIRSTQSAGTSPIRFVLPASSQNRELYLVSGTAATYNTVTQISSISFTDYRASNVAQQGNYLIIYHPSLNAPDNTNTRWVEEYRKYRDLNDNPTSGKFIARMFDINQLYEQFAYGVQKSPLAIRNFIRYATDSFNTATKPTHVFLMGKGREYNVMRDGGSAAAQCLIPTFGYPGSDNLFASKRNSDFPSVAIGRLAAADITQVRDYLGKIKQYETEQRAYAYNQTIPEKIWQKKLLHFSGGTTTNEQQRYHDYIVNYQKVAQDTLWGAKVDTFSKVGSDPISESLSQVIRHKIEDGVSQITFFGHSATGAFDFSIDEPENYTNYGKYPVILSNGCFSGLIHDATPGFSERFVLEADKGAIAFMATSSLSSDAGLNTFSSNYYKEITNLSYDTTLGQAVKNTLKDIYTCCSGSNFDVMIAYEMTLHGDPGIQLNQYPKPDYAIEQNSSLFFTPTTITPGLDSFDVNLVVTNLGKAIKDSIAVTITRTIFDYSNYNPAGIPYYYRKVVKAPYYIDTVTFRMPTKIGTIGYGDNLFNAYVDADYKIDEMAEGNNGWTNNEVSINIQDDDVVPIYPYEFAIVPKQGVTLKASTINPFAPIRGYRFEIDTTEKFNSPLKQSSTITQAGGVLHWAPTLTYIDSTVYYWRVAIDSSSPKWHYTSFIYLKDEYPGWNQSHYYQWKKDSYLQISLDSADRKFKFPPTVNELHVLTGKSDAVGGPISASTLGYDYNNNNLYRYRMGSCQFYRGITFAVIDNLTGEPLFSKNVSPYDNYGDKFGNYHCQGTATTQYGFDFATSGNHPTLGITWSEAIKNFIDSIPCNAYVLVYSTNDVAYTSWDNTLVQALQSIGFSTADSFRNGSINGPFIFFTQKCNNTYPKYFAYQNGYNTALEASITFNGTWYQGSFTSPKIGPAVQWGSMHWRRHSLDNPSFDNEVVDVIGVPNSGNDTVLLSSIVPDNFINNVNAVDYPYIKLRLRSTDSTNRTPTQMDYWRILYKKPPEAAMNPGAWFRFTDSVNLGGSLHLELGLESITEVDMDSMLVKYSIRDAQQSSSIAYIRNDSLRGLDTMHLIFDQPITSSNFNGLNKLVVEANPDGDQIEQYHFNNYAELNFNSIGDNVNPLLDVTFDGEHIFNGDIVSAKPTILVTLKDENKFLALDDTSLVSIYLKAPDQSAPQRLSYDDVSVKFYPANPTTLNKNNKASVEIKKDLPIDGTYELIVKDKDKSGNNSSTTQQHFESNIFYDYKISFEVINKPMVTNVLNYPNPFTTSTQFVFTITGSEIPDYMKIQIMTIKGTVVKEITKDELGPLHIGRNITEYTWDGRDQYGDQLANGVYFYRVVTRLDDKRMDHMDQGYDKYFKKGFGKMVIIR